MSYLTDFLPPIAATGEVQARSKRVLEGWRCVCVGGCTCFEYRCLLALCAEGKPLYPKQHDIIQRLLSPVPTSRP